MKRPKYINDLSKVIRLSVPERESLRDVSKKFRFRASNYYLSLIDWDDPDDPIRKIILPHVSELTEFGHLDASDEESNYVAPGCQHKYYSTVLLLCNQTCAGYCRFCFRKRLFMGENDEAVNNVSQAIEYIRRTPQVTDVLLTGGDPLILSSAKLERIIRPIYEIDHVRMIRIGTKIPAFNPYRIINDPDLCRMLARYSARRKRLYVMTHFTHPRELTDTAVEALDLLLKAGTILCNQAPVLKGITDKPEILAELMTSLSAAGVVPYYFFHCRPTAGNLSFALPLTQAFQVFEQAKRNVGGLSKRARLVMSHAQGKIEIVALTDRHIFMKFHRARNSGDRGRFLIYNRDDHALWFDDLKPIDESAYTALTSAR